MDSTDPGVVLYLRAGGTLDELASKYAVKATRHRRYPSLVLLKYNEGRQRRNEVMESLRSIAYVGIWYSRR